MGLNDMILALIRRGVVSAVAFVLSWLVIHLGVGIDASTSATVTAFVVLVVVAAYGWVAQLLEKQYPWLGKILFLGASRQVTYTKHPS